MSKKHLGTVDWNLHESKTLDPRFAPTTFSLETKPKTIYFEAILGCKLPGLKSVGWKTLKKTLKDFKG